MRKFLVVLMLCLSTSVFADSIGGNYSFIEPHDSGVDQGNWEVYGVNNLTDDIDLTVKGILVNDHNESGYGSELEAGFNFKFPTVSSMFTPWVNPAITFVSQETGGDYMGYNIKAGIDVPYNKFTITPTYEYSNDFGDREVAKSAFGPKVAYTLDKNWLVYSSFRHEWNQDKADDNRLYFGTEYKF